MIEEIVKAYKCYNTGVKLRCILFVIGIFITFIFMLIMKIVGRINMAMPVIYVVAIVTFANITAGDYKLWVRSNWGYGKFIRIIKNSYLRLKIMAIISILQGIAYYLIYFTFFNVICMILKIQNFFSSYQIFYGILLGFFLLGINQILAYCFKNGSKVDIFSTMFICSMIGGETDKFLTNSKYLAIISDVNTIVITVIAIIIYLSIVYSIVFRMIRKRWMVQ